jgi:hypothetical protein
MENKIHVPNPQPVYYPMGLSPINPYYPTTNQPGLNWILKQKIKLDGY